MNSTQNTQIPKHEHIKAWTKLIYSRLAFRQNHMENKDAVIPGVQLNIDAM